MMTRGEKITAWLLGSLIAICFVMVTLGGYVRLSGSGLSIPEWPFFTIEERIGPQGELVPRRSVWPPSTEEGWVLLRDTFTREIPGYEGIGLAPFKRMFWIEWGHRALAKFIGVVYLAFMGAVFWFPEVRRRFWGFAVGGLLLLAVQAFLGGVVVWLHLPAVKVAAHLIFAFFFVSLLLWALLKLLHPPAPRSERRGPNPILPWAIGLYIIFTIQIFSGGIMAGSYAGYQFNTWPKIGDSWVPPGMRLPGDSLYKTFTENIIFIQFFHRWFAFLALFAAIVFVIRSMTVGISRPARWAVRLLTGVVVLQILLGIFTLLFGVQPVLALAHQSVGLVLLLNALVIVYETARHKVVGEQEMAALMEQKSSAERAAIGGDTVNA